MDPLPDARLPRSRRKPPVPRPADPDEPSRARPTRLARSSPLRGVEARLLDAVDQAVVATDPAGRIVYWNRYAEALFGWAADEVVDRPIGEVCPALTPGTSAHVLARLSRGDCWRGELDLLRKDGSPFRAEVVESPFLDGDELVGIVTLTREVAVPGRGQTAREERRVEARLRTLVNAIDEGYAVGEVVLDADGVPCDVRLLEVNPRFEQLTGLVAATGKVASELLSEPEPQWLERLARVGLGGRTMRFSQGAAELGRSFEVFAIPVQPRGTFAVVFTDRTREHRVAAALRESEQRFRLMADQLPLLMWEQGSDGELIWVNGTLCDYFGVTPEDMRGSRWLALVHADDRAAYRQMIIDAVRQRRPFNSEVRFLRRDGQWRWLESWATPRFTADGEYLGHLGVSADVTPRRAAEAALRARADLDAFRARLADAMRLRRDPVDIQVEAARVLGEHLAALRVHYAETDDSGRRPSVQVDYHLGTASAAGRHRLDEYGQAVIEEFRAGRRVIVDNVATDPRISPEERQATASLGVSSYVLEPLLKDGRTVAALVVHSSRPRRWSEQDLAAIDETAQRTQVAVERARAEEALRRRHAMTELAAEILSSIERERGVAGQLRRLASMLVPRFADQASVELRDGDLVMTTTAPDAPAQASGSTPDPFPPEAGRTMTVPLDLGGGVHGAIRLRRSGHGPAYDSDALSVMERLADRAGVILAASRLREQEHDIAVRLQKALLPDKLIWNPNLLMEARYIAASDLLEVGGDWYDSFAWPGGQVGVVVGDVVGHNLDSAATMGRLRAATAAAARQLPPSPAAILDALEQFAQGPDGTDYATAVCAVVDPARGVLTYSSAGHPPGLVLAPGRAPLRLTGAQAPPICFASAGPRTERTVTLEPGALVILYTDGLIERRHDNLDDGLDRLEQAAVTLADKDVNVVVERLVDRLTSNSPAEDDIVVACFRYTPVLASLEHTMPARGEQLAVLRKRMRRWLDDHAISGRSQQAVLLGVGEACGNAVEHGYWGHPPGHVDVRLAHHGRHLVAEITDHGQWRPKSGHSQHRGHGTPIMRALTMHFERDTGPAGTRVRLTFPLSAPGTTGPATA